MLMPRRHLQDTPLLLSSRTVAARGMERCFSRACRSFGRHGHKQMPVKREEKGAGGRAAAGQSEINRPTVQWEGKVGKEETGR